MRKQDSVLNITRVSLKGNCDDKYCRFAHSLDELRHTDNLFKTSLCIQFEKGLCKGSENCRYAHGCDELKKLITSGDSDETVPIKESLTQQNFNDSPHYNKNFYSDESDSISVSSEQSYFDVEDNRSPMFCPAKFRYNYLNPFYFYTINNFPIQHSVPINQTVPYLNYLVSHGGNNITTDSKKMNSGMLSTRSDSGLISKQQNISYSTNTNESPLRKTHTVTHN